ncbi:MAG: hypothetical protein ACR2IJ_07295 [Fluviibacter sp.]
MSTLSPPSAPPQPSDSSENGATLIPLPASILQTPHAALRCAATIRISSAGWTIPLWQDAHASLSALLDPQQYQREILAWTFCETQRQLETQMREARRNTLTPRAGQLAHYGPVSWLAVWEEQNKQLVNSMTEAELGEAMLFFAEEFYPRVDYWRSRVGFERVPDIWEGLRVQWPSEQLRPIIVSIQHGPEKYEVETGYETGSDVSGLLRLQWIRQLWAWEKGVLASPAPQLNFESTSVTSSIATD